jgi:hypothetical protein
MGLDFTSIKDKSGAAVYIVHDGSVSQQRQCDKLAAELNEHTPKHQVLVISIKSHDGEQIANFYSLDRMSFPHALVVRDNDELAHHWYGHNGIPRAAELAFTLRSVSEN